MSEYLSFTRDKKYNKFIWLKTSWCVKVQYYDNKTVSVKRIMLYCVWGYMFRSLHDHHQAFLRIKSRDSWFQSFAVIWILYIFFWVFPRRQIVVGRRFGTLYQFHPHTVHPAFEDGTDTGFRNVGQLQFDAGEIPRRKYTISQEMLATCWDPNYVYN